MTESTLVTCRETLTARVRHYTSFCLRARCSLDRFELVARGDARPSPLLYSAARLAASEAATVLRSYLDRCVVREAWLRDQMPQSFSLPPCSLKVFQQLTAWQLPLLNVTLGRVTQEDVAVTAGVTRQYVCNAERGRCKLSVRLAIAYLTHVTTELSYVASAYAAVESAWESLALAAPPGWVPEPDGARSEATAAPAIPQHVGGWPGGLAQPGANR